MRRCKIVSPCCGVVFPCRLCHDEKLEESNQKVKHKLDRFKIERVVCNACELEQAVGQYCSQCGACFGLYYCDVCHLFDDVDKGQFHCDACGMCRIGGRENFIHCDACNICISKVVEKDHKCFNVKESVCPICWGDIATSVVGITFMKCGHYIHKQCFIDMLNTSYKCPICSVTVVDTTEYNKLLDTEISQTPMPQDYKDTKVTILCNDCHKENEVGFHIIAHKCTDCGGYNTRRT